MLTTMWFQCIVFSLIQESNWGARMFIVRTSTLLGVWRSNRNHGTLWLIIQNMLKDPLGLHHTNHRLFPIQCVYLHLWEHLRSTHVHCFTIFSVFGEAAEIMEPCQWYTKQVLNESKNRFAWILFCSTSPYIRHEHHDHLGNWDSKSICGFVRNGQTFTLSPCILFD